MEDHFMTTENLKLDIRCGEGKIQILESTDIIRVQQFKKTLWTAPRQDVTRFLMTKQGVTTLEFTICTTSHGKYHAKMVLKKNFELMQALLSGVETHYPAGNKWYHDLEKTTHSVTYKNDKEMNKDMEAAAQFGWMPQTSAASLGNVSGFAVAAFGAASNFSRKKEVTLIYVRTPEWLAMN